MLYEVWKVEIGLLLLKALVEYYLLIGRFLVKFGLDKK